MRDKAWFFAALRRGAVVERHQPHRGRGRPHRGVSDTGPGSSTTTRRAGSRSSRSPAGSARHDVQAFYQRDRLLLTGDREYNYEPIHGRSRPAGRSTAARSPRCGGRASRPPSAASYNGKGGIDASTFDTLGLTGPQIIIHNNATPCGRDAAGHRPHPRRRQPPVVQLPAGVADRRARRSHLLQGRLGREPRGPDRLLLRAAQHLQPGHPLRERRLRARGAPADRRQQHRRRHGPVPPPLPDARSTCGRARPRTATSPSTSRTRGGRHTA